MVKMECLRDNFGKDYFEIDPAKTALLVIDMQNTFLAKGAVFESPMGRAIIPGINDMILFCREHNIPVIYTFTDHSFPTGGMIHRRHPVTKYTHETWPGDVSHELYHELEQPIEGDISVLKHKYDAFHETDLHRILYNLGKDTIIITGVATEICCESTARGGFFNDYKVVFTRDATGAFNPDIQEECCDLMNKMFARAMTLEDVKSEIIENL